MSPSTADVQATFCATLVDEWVRAGVSHAVIAPGSRNTPMSVAIADRPELAIHIVHDERSAAFMALGLGLEGVPALLLCTSGTAGVNFHPAVVEADLSAVPMIVITADRPPELRDVGAPQTIDQTRLYGHSVRWFHDPGVAAAEATGTWRSLSRRALAAALGARGGAAGPIHLNLPFREPLLGTPQPLPEPPEVGPWGSASAPAVAAADVDREVIGRIAGDVDHQRGVIVAGGRSGVAPDVIGKLAAATSWPVLADPASGARHLDAAVSAFDDLLRHERFAADHAPNVVVRIGRPPASKVLGTWLGSSDPVTVQIGGPATIDPDHRAAIELPPAAAGLLADRLQGATGTTWLARWRTAEQRAQQAIASVLADEPLSEPAIARTIAEWLPDDAELVVASSMPVRDLEWYGGPAARAHANRGANGIDGTLSTALGRALAGHMVVALVGDLAFMHDLNALIAVTRRGVDLRIVVVDNDGGGIFSFLPQAGALPGDRFEQLFGTPHGSDLVALATAHGVPARTVTTRDDLLDGLAEPGPSVLRVRSDRPQNVELHHAIHRAVDSAL